MSTSHKLQAQESQRRKQKIKEGSDDALWNYTPNKENQKEVDNIGRLYLASSKFNLGS